MSERRPPELRLVADNPAPFVACFAHERPAEERLRDLAHAALVAWRGMLSAEATGNTEKLARSRLMLDAALNAAEHVLPTPPPRDIA